MYQSMQNRVGSKRPALLFGLLMLMMALALSACGAADEGLSVGDTAPAFTLPAADGGTVSLADYAGQPTLLYFHMAMG